MVNNSHFALFVVNLARVDADGLCLFKRVYMVELVASMRYLFFTFSKSLYDAANLVTSVNYGLISVGK